MSHGLTPRPVHPEDVAAALSAALALTERPPSAPSSPALPAWRFSGRWFHHGPLEQRRPRR